MTQLPCLAFCTALLALASAGAVAEDMHGRDTEEQPAFQVFLGVLELDDQTGEWDEISDGDVDVDFGSLFSGGIESEYVFYRNWMHLGINAGGSFAWKNDDTRFSGGFTEDTGGFLRVNIDNSLLLLELHLGGYVRGRLHDRVTTYAAAGPMLMYGSHEVEDEQVEASGTTIPVDSDVALTESDANDVNIGYYARAGIDFEIARGQHFGLGVRYLSTELDFDDTIGKLDIEGPQYVLTFTAGL